MLPTFDDDDPELVNYHIGLCSEAGFIHADERGLTPPKSYEIWNLTWDGHEFLEKHRD